MQQQGTISRSDYNVWWKVDFIWQPASWLDWEEAPKHFPKPNLHPKMVIVIVWWSAAHLINYSFLNPSKAITSEKYAQQINEMHWKLQCLQLALVNRVGPILHDNAQPHVAQPTLPNLNELSYEVLSHPPYSPDLSPTDYHLQASQQLFAGKMLPQPAGGRKCFLRVHWILNTNFYATGIINLNNNKTNFSLAEMCWLSWFLFWLIKMSLSLVTMISNSWSETAITFSPTWTTKFRGTQDIERSANMTATTGYWFPFIPQVSSLRIFKHVLTPQSSYIPHSEV